MSVSIPRRLFTVDEYYRMAAAGVFRPDERVELLDGEIVPMNPIGSEHAWCVTRLNRVFSQELGGRFIVWVQNPLRIRDRCEPEADVTVVRGDCKLIWKMFLLDEGLHRAVRKSVGSDRFKDNPALYKAINIGNFFRRLWFHQSYRRSLRRHICSIAI